MKKYLFFDPEKCSACGACAVACMDQNDTDVEAGELPLEELLKRYEEGVKLATDLEKMLEAAKGRMQEITAGQDGAPKLTPTEMAEQGSLLDALKEE